MRDKIIILSHSFHSFLINEVECASNVFKKVIVLTEDNKQLRDKFKFYDNVEFEFFNKKDVLFSSFSNFSDCFSYTTFLDLVDAISKDVFDIMYLKQLLSFWGVSKLTRKCVRKYLKDKDASSFLLLASWYFEDAYAVARVKTHIKNIATVSLAHSYEIDAKKNKYIEVLYRKWYHKKLNKVSFISQNVCNEYKNSIANKLQLNTDNLDISYLGTKKQLQGINPGNNEKNLVVVSCSYIVPVKRLSLLFDGLCCIAGLKVRWVHIGDGQERSQLEKLVKEKVSGNLTVELLGSRDNIFVHQFFCYNPIDVFVNTSSSEGIPVTIMEALAYGIPVVATNVGGNSEIVDNNCGRLLRENPTPEQIANAIIELKNQSSDEKKITQSAAMAKYNELFNSDRIRVKFYQKLKEM